MWTIGDIYKCLTYFSNVKYFAIIWFNQKTGWHVTALMPDCYNRSKMYLRKSCFKQPEPAAQAPRYSHSIPRVGPGCWGRGTGCGPGLTKQLTISSARAATQIMQESRETSKTQKSVPHSLAVFPYFYLHVLVAVCPSQDQGCVLLFLLSHLAVLT